MDKEYIKSILLDLKDGRISVETCINQLQDLPFKDIGIACIDHHRNIRKGVPEIIFGKGKEVNDILNIIQEMNEKGDNILITKLSSYKAEFIKKRYPEAKYYKKAMILTITKRPIEIIAKGLILVISAGTSDIPIAEEAFITAKFLGNRVDKIYDVGIAGLHRILAHVDKIREASVLIVVAGMEGALPSVIAGLVEKPIIAVPTSVGYGASFSGIASLLSMLNSCAPGVTVVNIDNGFGAAYAASIINKGALSK